MTLKFNRTYTTLALLLLTIEVLIAIYLKTGFIRHTFGDYLAVILIYTGIKSIIDIHPFKLAVGVLLLAFLIEFLQLFKILKFFNLQNNQVLKLILGSTFHFSDLVAYTLGILTIIIIEYKIYKLWIT